ncbi:hydrogenase large subunit [Anaeromyxobacter diazotrophicus]|uniref:Hydrogenase n=1 Tax=Anaeromyxobacter diazotrophicus TaxID=2590199 RepID=A0A7I9VKH6_9BACT|nr:NADH-quinone oxidoreductase subunit C [Anaeromyxobacter diazotrophicus]GEJ56891.1 hydrogenase [Anaeromyxobacter diazotrophicus]
MSGLLETWNGEAVEAREVPLVPVDRFQDGLCQAIAAGGRVSALFGRRHEENRVLVTAVLADDRESRLGLLSTVVGARWPSLSDEFPALQAFERELAEQYGVVPEGHPWLKPLRFEHARMPVRDAFGRSEPFPDIPGDYPFFRVEGEEIHEVAVGPVHAGIIEPGHFRFQCHGEQVLHLEISLGYQHRGAERLLEGASLPRALRLAESLAGDTSIGHGLAFCRAMEALAGVEAPPRGSYLRGIALELERLANHVGDLGAIAGDVGFQPTAAGCGALRAEFLNATAELCGNRFGRGLLVPGGVRVDLSAGDAARLADKLANAFARVRESVALLFRSPSARNRTDGTGVVSRELCDALGLVGPAARASGASRDVRRDHPFGLYRFTHLPVATGESGDVFARAWVRWLEIDRSAGFVLDHLRGLPEGPVRAALPALPPGRLAVSMVEGWRGEIAHVALTDDQGRLGRYKVKDPSFHNWMGLAQALRGEQVSDFPLCNKSFNLSYAGHDL